MCEDDVRFTFLRSSKRLSKPLYFAFRTGNQWFHSFTTRELVTTALKCCANSQFDRNQLILVANPL